MAEKKLVCLSVNVNPKVLEQILRILRVLKLEGFLKFVGQF